MRSWSLQANSKSRQDGSYTITFPGDVEFPATYYAWAYKNGYGVPLLNFGNQFHTSHQVEGLDIILPESTPIQVEVLTSAGLPMTDAMVGPRRFNLPSGPFMANEPIGVADSPPLQILKATAVKTDEKGMATLTGYAKGLIGAVLVKSKDHGEQSFWYQGEDKFVVNFGATTRLHFGLVTPTTKLYQGKHVRVFSNGNYLDPLTNKRFINDSAEYTVAFDE